jgi:uncharacterized protein (TIGR02246 family)
MRNAFFVSVAAMMLNAVVMIDVYGSDTSDAIAAANQEFEVALGRSDAAGLAAHYTQDGQLLPPNHGVVSGAEAIQAFWQGAIDGGITGVALETIELDEHGDTAIEVGQYTLNGADGQLVDKGKFIVIWKNEDGQWKLHRDMWSSVSAPK